MPIDFRARSIPAVLSAGRQYNVEAKQSEPRLAVVQEIRLNGGMRGRGKKEDRENYNEIRPATNVMDSDQKIAEGSHQESHQENLFGIPPHFEARFY